MVNPVDILILGAGCSPTQLAALQQAGYNCMVEPSFGDPLATIDKHNPLVLLLDASDVPGMDAIRTVRADARATRVPVAAINIGDGPEALQTARETGADDVFESDTSPEVMVARMRPLLRLSAMESELLRRTATAEEFTSTIGSDIERPQSMTGGSLLVVGCEEGELEALCPLLAGTQITFTAEPDPYRARHRVEGGNNESFDGALVYVRDEDMREKCGYFCRTVRNDRRLYDLPLFLVTNRAAFPNEAAAYEEGANVVAEAPVDCDFVQTHLHLLLRGRERRRALADGIAATLTGSTSDELTGVYSMSFTRAHLAHLARHKAERGANCAAILFFIPTIGEVAALYGSQDAALLRQQMASWLAGLVRVEDMIGRAGADEFIALLPASGMAEAELVRKRVTGVLHQSEFRLSDNVPTAMEVYVQSGIAEIRADDTMEDLVTRASDLLE